jgi:1,4-alpha-glucan branching enzyme
MHVKLRKLVALLPLLVAGFTPNEAETPAVEAYYQYRLLKEAAPPREVKSFRAYDSGLAPRMESGLLFTYKSRSARRVELAGSFNEWKPVPLVRGDNGVWYYLLANLTDPGEIRYKFLVDGLWTRDPRNTATEDDGTGSYVSVAPHEGSSEGTHLTYRIVGKNLIEFRLYKPDARMISLVGDFNNWNPENDLMKRERNGVWRLQKKLRKGNYRYKYLVDGAWSVDTFNSSTSRDDLGKLCSRLMVE